MSLSKDEIVKLLADDEHEQELLEKADSVRHEFVGDEVHLRGLIEFSNICRNDCLYCGLRKGNCNLKRYRLEADDLLETARKAADLGFKTIVMQSGEDLYYDAAKMCHIVENIKN